MRVMLLTALLSTVAVPLRGQDLVDHSGFADVLNRVWRDGLVDYAAAQAGRGDLDAYVATLGAVPESAVGRAPRNEQLAFWINAYNACTMTLVLDHYPIVRRYGPGSTESAVNGVPANSIQQIPDTWKREFCPVAGKVRSLDEIEHSIIRPMGEPRIHFAINCAARSCPQLAPVPYVAERLDEQLDEAVRVFMENDLHFSFGRAGRASVHVNKVLDWFKEDFGGVDGVAAFFLPRLTEADRSYARDHGPLRVTFRDYDWTLNDTAVFGNEPRP